MNSGRLRDAYDLLERRMKALADEDGDIFLPNVPPDSMADYVFICMEPSLGTWAGHDPAKATAKISQGFRNFVYSTTL